MGHHEHHTARAHSWSPTPQTDFQPRQKLQKEETSLRQVAPEKKRNCPGRNDLQVPIQKNKEAAELRHQQDLFRKRDPAGKNLHGDLKGYLQTA